MLENEVLGCPTARYGGPSRSPGGCLALLPAAAQTLVPLKRHLSGLHPLQFRGLFLGPKRRPPCGEAVDLAPPALYSVSKRPFESESGRESGVDAGNRSPKSWKVYSVDARKMR